MQYNPSNFYKLIKIVLFYSLGYFKYRHCANGLLQVNNTQGLIG